MSKIPCEECLCVPICRFKEYRQLLKECVIIQKILYNSPIIDVSCRSEGYHSEVLKVYEALSPTTWALDQTKDPTLNKPIVTEVSIP
ncbi:MAG: hypothetical protein ACTSW1_07705 [Candidatus Hodarchaeales archaeon]